MVIKKMVMSEASRCGGGPMIITHLLLCLLLLLLLVESSKGQIDGINGGYWFTDSGITVADIDSSLFTHLFCSFVKVDPNSGSLTIPSECATFSDTVRRRNPSVITLLSIGGGTANSSEFNRMASQPNSRRVFIDQSISLARSNAYDGLDLDWEQMTTPNEMANFGTLVSEWRAALDSEASSTGNDRLILTAAVNVDPVVNGQRYPATVIAKSMDWINVMAYDFYAPKWSPSQTAGPAVLRDPTGGVSGSRGINAWVNAGVPREQMALGLPFYGYAWKLVDPNKNGLLAPASGPSQDSKEVPTYKQIKEYISQRAPTVVYNSAYVTNYCYLGTTWIGYDDTRSISAKVSYAKSNGLFGYFAWHLAADNNWALSKLAKQTWAA